MSVVSVAPIHALWMQTWPTGPQAQMATASPGSMPALSFASETVAGWGWSEGGEALDDAQIPKHLG
jgi:hypothetical protein